MSTYHVSDRVPDANAGAAFNDGLAAGTSCERARIVAKLEAMLLEMHYDELTPEWDIRTLTEAIRRITAEEPRT